jgi:MFS family permease
MRLFNALRHRPFALLWSGQTISRIGDFTYQIALAWWVLQKTGSAATMGKVMIFAFAPMLLFLLIGGAAVDRFHRIGVMLLSDLLRGVLVLAVATLALAGRLYVWQVYAVSLLFGFVDAFFNPAYAAAMPEVVPAAHLPSANALTSLSQQFGRIVGPPIGAGMVAIAGTGWAFAVDGISFFVSAACLLPLMRGRGRPQTPSRPQPALVMASHGAPDELGITADVPSAGIPVENQGQTGARTEEKRACIFRDVAKGIGFVRRTPWLLISISMFTLVNVLLAGPYAVSMPFLVKDHLRKGVGVLGLLYAMFPLGCAIAAGILGHAGALRRRGSMIFCGAAVAGIMMIPFGLAAPVVALAVAAAVNGFALEVAGLSWTNLIQERVPAGMLGRVASLDSLGSFALLPVGYAMAGWSTDHIGAPAVFLIGGTCAAIVAMLGLTRPTVRGLD